MYNEREIKGEDIIKADYEQRLYGFVPYNISEIQRGIQFGHAAIEYSLMYNNTAQYRKWATVDKTFIILNGGTSGNMLELKNQLVDMGINHSEFFEPDLNNMLSSITFLVDERVYNKQKYPDYVNPYNPTNVIIGGFNQNNWKYEQWVKEIGGEQNVKLRQFLSDKKLA